MMDNFFLKIFSLYSFVTSSVQQKNIYFLTDSLIHPRDKEHKHVTQSYHSYRQEMKLIKTSILETTPFLSP